jgi:hypothetical protein
MPYDGKTSAFWAVSGPDVERRETSYVVESPVTHYRASGDPLA